MLAKSSLALSSNPGCRLLHGLGCLLSGLGGLLGGGGGGSSGGLLIGLLRLLHLLGSPEVKIRNQ